MRSGPCTGTVVFTVHLEGEEVQFGRLAVEYGPTARILTFAAGFEYTTEMKDFNGSFSLEILNRSTGRSLERTPEHTFT